MAATRAAMTIGGVFSSPSQRPVVRQLQRRGGDAFGDELEHELVVVREVVAPAVAEIDAAAVMPRHLAFVIAEEAAPQRDLPRLLAAILLREDAGVRHAGEAEGVGV